MAASSAGKKKRSGNPAKKVSTAKSWKRNKGEDLELPSNNVALVKRPGPQALLSDGIMPDTLMPIVQQAIQKGKGLRPQDLNLENPSVLADMLDSIDKLVVAVVVEPKVAYHKELIKFPTPEGGFKPGEKTEEWRLIPEERRDRDEFVYVDEVDLEDKMFIFNYAVGGTRDLERFRREHEASLGNVPDGQGNEDPPE